MAPMLSRLFSNRKHSPKSCFTDDISEYQSHRPFKFDSEKQIRLLLYRDCHVKGRKLLFDSKTIRRKEKPKQLQRSSPSHLSSLNLQWTSAPKQLQPHPGKDTKTEISDGVTYEYLLPSSDTNLLGEMILGSVALSYQCSMKVHTIRSPSQLMLSIVFPAPSHERTKEKNGKPSTVLHNSSSEININRKVEKTEFHCARSVPLDVPDAVSYKESCSIPESLHSSTSNSSLQSNPSFHDSSTLAHSGSFNNLYRRKMRNFSTSLEHGIRYKPAGSLELDRMTKKKINLGLSIIISLDKDEQEEKQFEEFFFTHILLIECHLHKLKEEITQAYFERQSFIHKVYEALKKIQKVLQDLYSGPRLFSPLWLTIISNTSGHQEKYRCFVQEFVALLEEFDTKSTNFFVSTLLTAVLTHHLSWVSSVVPASARSHFNYHKRNKTDMMDYLAKSHSYNPLWIQLGDVYGAIGCQPKLTRMVLTGKKLSVIHRFLFAFSYFIRCSDVVEQEQNMASLSSENYHFTNKIYCERTWEEQSTSIDNSFKLRKSCVDSSYKLIKNKGDLSVALPQCASDNCEKCNFKNEVVPSLCHCKQKSKDNWIQKSDTEYYEMEKLPDYVSLTNQNSEFVCSEDQEKATHSVAVNDLKVESLPRKVVDEDFQQNDKCTESADINRDGINSKSDNQISKDSESVLFFIGENPKSNVEIIDEVTDSKKVLLDTQDKVTKKSVETKCFTDVDDSVKGDQHNSFPQKICSKPEIKFQDFNSTWCVPGQDTTRVALQLPSSGNSIHQKQKIVILKDPSSNLNGKSNNSLYGFSAMDEHLVVDHRDVSNVHVSYKLSTVEEIEEDSSDDISVKCTISTSLHGDNLQEQDCDKVTGSNFSPCDNSTEKLLQSIDDRKFYIQEYHNLRFAPERCSTLATSTENVENISSAFDNCKNHHQVRRGCRSESPEDGYHSMEDTKYSQNEMPSKDNIMSSQLNISLDGDLLSAVTEMPFPRVAEKNDKMSNMYRSLGWSLMGGITDHFMSCFSLQGIHDGQKGQSNYKKLRDEITEELSTFSTFPIFGDVTQAVCILADIDHLKIQLLSSDKRHDVHVAMSPLVSEICESLLQMCLLNLSPEYCIMYLENRLQELYFKSLSLAEWLCENKSADRYEKIAKSLKLDLLDIPLLLAIVSGHELCV